MRQGQYFLKKCEADFHLLQVKSLATAENQANRDQSQSSGILQKKGNDLAKSASIIFHSEAGDRSVTETFLLSQYPGNSEIFIIIAYIYILFETVAEKFGSELLQKINVK